MTDREPRGAGLAIGPDPDAPLEPAGAAIGSAVPAQPTELVYDTGVELQARTQWAFARRRFLRHRLAMGSLVVLLTVFALGIFANVVAPYSYSDVNINALTQAPSAKH
jgi:peptide/nickel transport system permease protein